MVWLFLQDWAFRTEAETKKSRVSWDTQICCYLDPSGTHMWAATPVASHVVILMENNLNGFQFCFEVFH